MKSNTLRTKAKSQRKGVENEEKNINGPQKKLNQMKHGLFLINKRSVKKGREF